MTAQQQLVALVVNVRLVQSLLARSARQAAELLESLDRSAEQAVADLVVPIDSNTRADESSPAWAWS